MTVVAGSSTSVVKAKVISTTAVLAIAMSSTIRLAPVSRRTRRWPIETMVKTSSAMALPIERWS